MSDRDKRNAKDEFLKIIKDYKVIAACVSFDRWDEEDVFKLKPLYTDEDYENFMNFMNRIYDSGYGGQNLYGVVYCEGGVWMQRDEYDGAEWWNIFKYPDLRDSFDDIDVIKYERFIKLKNLENL